MLSYEVHNNTIGVHCLLMKNGYTAPATKSSNRHYSISVGSSFHLDDVVNFVWLHHICHKPLQSLYEWV